MELDLACQFLLNRYDMEIEKMRLSAWGVPKDKTTGKQNAKPATKEPAKKKMTKEDIMRNYK